MLTRNTCGAGGARTHAWLVAGTQGVPAVTVTLIDRAPISCRLAETQGSVATA